MLCHFGQELHDQHKQFNIVFSELYKLGSETNHTLETYLPLRELFMQDYSCLEKILVLINMALFVAGLSSCSPDKKVDQEVSTAILYLMFAISYFVTTTMCLSGANNLKRKACYGSGSDKNEMS